MDEKPKQRGATEEGRALRVAVDGLAAVTAELQEIRQEWKKESETRTKSVREQVEGTMKQYVPWIAHVGILLTFIAINWGMTDKQVAPTKSDAALAVSKSIATEAALKDLARDLAIELVTIKANAKATADVTVRGEKPSVVKEELERRTGEKRTPRR